MNRVYRVRNDLTEAEFDAFRALDRSAYPTGTVPCETLRGWWAAYPRGLIGLFELDRVVGGMGIWPLSPRGARELGDGRLHEAQLEAAEMDSYRDRPAGCWYVGGVVVRSDRQRSPAVRELLMGGLTLWQKTCPLAYPLEVLAQGASAAGVACLRRASFRLLRDGVLMPDGLPLSGARLSSAGELTERFRRRRRRSPGGRHEL